MKLRGMGMVLKMADKDTITITDQFLTEEKKTMIYKLDEPVEYKIMGESSLKNPNLIKFAF